MSEYYKAAPGHWGGFFIYLQLQALASENLASLKVYLLFPIVFAHG